VLLETTGRGHYVGTVYSAHQMEMGWFGEGDDFFFIDGAEYPQLRGTGTEDYFNDAWGFRAHCKPYSGVTLYDGVFPGDRVTAYRWHIADPIPFRSSLRVEMEHRGSVFNPDLERGGVINFELGGFLERPDWVSSVTFWYQSPAATINEALPPAAERTAPCRIIKASTLKRRAEPAMMVLPDTERLTYLPFKHEATIELTLDIAEPGTYQINCITGKLAVGGVYQAHLDDKPVGLPIDGTGTGSDTVWTCLDLHKLDAGEHKLKFVSVPGGARRTLTPGVNLFMMEKILLLRLEDMRGFQEVYEKAMKERGF
jgi:hypothetical protein